MTVTGPFAPTGASDTPSRQRVFICKPPSLSAGAPEGVPYVRNESERACAERIVRTLTRRAYRREVTSADTAPLMAFYEQGRREAGFEQIGRASCRERV